ncbi:hypothetical protein ACE1CI_35020 [Aerosakkonemataceae cyanobacterium BLCC-F50]|uniref:Glycosyltransferase RgtA/B/C/D-like domain-containing protein n=1 Tax=Floridaenema flaviceps BLCC-F50 TaxID=3153642 RepID=A0ABV4Y3W9_9CYAN
MTFNNSRFDNFVPYLITFFLVTLLFGVSLIHPFRIDADSAFQIKSVQQWLRGESNLINALVLPNPQDISKDVQAWTLWWPPGVPVFFLPLIAIGLPLGIAAKITVYCFFLLGCLGWLKLADAIRTNLPTKLVIAFTLPIYSITIASLTELIGDVIPFGIMPWLFLYTLYVSWRFKSQESNYKQTIVHSGMLGVVLGTLYWLKYSAFLVSLGIGLYLGISLLFFDSKYSLSRRLFLLGAFTVCLFLPFISLNLLNQYLTGMSTAMTQNAEYFKPGLATQGVGLLVSFLGSLGLALFQAYGGLMHLIYFSDRLIPLFASWGPGEREIPLAIAGIPGTVVVIWLLLYSRKLYDKSVFILCCCVTFVPFLLLGYLTGKVGFNFIVHNIRYVSAFFIFTQILLVSAYIHYFKNNHKRAAKFLAVIILILFFIFPNFFTVGNFARNGVFERIGEHYITTANKLYVPVLSKVNVKSVVEQINSVVKSPQDIVVLALDEPAPFGAWLEMKQRTLPLVDAWGPLVQTHGTEGANLRGASKFTSSKDLRLILVISKSFESDSKMVLQIKQRFPQATKWIKVKTPKDEEVAVDILYSALKAL